MHQTSPPLQPQDPTPLHPTQTSPTPQENHLPSTAPGNPPPTVWSCSDVCLPSSCRSLCLFMSLELRILRLSDQVKAYMYIYILTCIYKNVHVHVHVLYTFLYVHVYENLDTQKNKATPHKHTCKTACFERRAALRWDLSPCQAFFTTMQGSYAVTCS